MNLKLSLGLTLAIIATLVFSYFCFTGFYFESGGNLNESIIRGTLYGIGLLILAIILWRLKSVSRNFKTYIILELLLLIAFIVAAIFSFPKFAYSFGISAHKDSIQKQVIAELTSIEKMYGEYNNYADSRYSAYDNRLQHIINNKSMDPERFSECGFISGNEDKQKDHKLFILKNELRHEGKYQNIKSQNLHWINNSKRSVYGWKSMSVVIISQDIDSLGYSWKKQLIEFSRKRQSCEPESTSDFVYDLNFKGITFKGGETITVLAIVVGIVIYFFLLVPYFLVSRDSKNRNFRSIRRKSSQYGDDTNVNLKN